MQAGSYTGPPPSPAAVCQHCGNVFVQDEWFCRRCGTKRHGLDASTGQHMMSATPDASSSHALSLSEAWHAESSSGGRRLRSITPPPGKTAPPRGAATTPPVSPGAVSRGLSLRVPSPTLRSLPVTVNTYTAPVQYAPTAGVVTDSFQMTQGFRAWIDAHVDARVDQAVGLRAEQAFHQLVDRELSNLASMARREAQSAASAALQQAEQRQRRVEGEVRCMWDAQARVLALFESISRDAERFFVNGRVRSEAVSTVEKVMSTIDELRRTVEQDGDGSAARFRHHDTAISELRRAHAEETARYKAGLAELQRLQAEASARQRQCFDELASACAMMAGTRQEASDLGQVVQRLELKLSTWRAELATEVSEEVRAATAAREAEAEVEKLKIESLQRDATASAAAKIELEARIEGMRLEISNLAASKEDFEARFKDSQQWLARRVESIYTGPLKELEGLHHEHESLAQHMQRAERWRTDIQKEIRALMSTREQDALALSGLRGEIEGRIERLQVELATIAATRDSYEFRLRETNEEFRKSMDAWMSNNQEELAALQRRLAAEMRAEIRSSLKSEQSAIAAIDEQLWLTDQRLGQRIDEVAHAQERSAVMVQVNESRGLLTKGRTSPPPTPSTPPAKLANSVSSDVERKVIVEEVHIGSEAWGGNPDARRVHRVSPTGAVSAMHVSSSSGGLSGGAGLSDAEQLERLRTDRRRHDSHHSTLLSSSSMRTPLTEGFGGGADSHGHKRQ